MIRKTLFAALLFFGATAAQASAARTPFTPDDPLVARQWYIPQDRTFDFWPEGLEANWPNVATLMQYAKEQGLIDRLFTREELFAPNTLMEFRI